MVSSRFHQLTHALRSKLVTLNWSLRNKLFARYRRSKLRNKSFSIICNNCEAGLLYQKFGLPYLTPTVGLFFFADDYIKFLKNFESFIQQPLKFANTSRHPEANIVLRKQYYPIGILGEDVEIHFLHYKTATEASEKWNRRKERINFHNLFFIYSDRDDFREEFLKEYETLPFEHKIFFSSKPLGKTGLVVFIRDFENESQVGESIKTGEYEKYFDATKWLNGEPDCIKDI
jgi:uncharacterized protein (DUF1919 family)